MFGPLENIYGLPYRNNMHTIFFHLTIYNTINKTITSMLRMSTKQDKYSSNFPIRFLSTKDYKNYKCKMKGNVNTADRK